MDKSKLLAALREETLPRLGAVREALRAAQESGDPKALGPVRELCHRVAGTGAMAGMPSLSRFAGVGEAVTQLALQGEAKVSPRLCSALSQVLDALEAELQETPAEHLISPVVPAPPVEAGQGRIAVISDEGLSGKLLVRVLEGAGLEVRRLTLAEAERAPAVDAVVLDAPAAEARLPQVDAVLTAALAARVPVLLTGKPELEALRPLAARADHFLPKPVEPEVLLSAIHALVAKGRRVAPAPSPAPAPARRALKVLVVDDSRVIRAVVRQALAAVGLGSVEARDGAEAVRLYDAEQPDAVISDVQMPGLDGTQLTRLLRERDPSRRVPIVVLSALADDASRRAGLAAGADAYLVKSAIDGPALLQALEAAGLPLR